MSNNPDILDPLIETIKGLSAVISEEIALLKTSRPTELEKLMPLKKQLLATYYKEMGDVNSRGGLQASGNGLAIRTLKKESRIFQAVLTQHERLLKALKAISENMIKAISDDVIKNQNQTSRYGADGSRPLRKSATSLSLNQTI